MCGQREELDMELALHMSMEEAHARRIGSNHDGRRGGPSNKSLDELDKEIADKIAEIERMAPNMKAMERLDDVEMKLADTEKEAEKARKDSKTARDQFNDVKKRRCASISLPGVIILKYLQL